MVKRPKYGNRKVFVDGIEFDSVKESKRYRQLHFMQKSGVISELELQPKFKFSVNGKWQFTYNADFKYYDNENKVYVVEDVKSVATAKNSTYRLKKRIIEASYGIEIKEVL